MQQPYTDKFASGAHEVVLKRIRDIPSLPEVVNKIIQLLSQPNAPASEVAHLISYDPGLTSKVLRMVNSAAYGFQRQISSIQHGIMILGFNTVRGLVLSASIFKMFENQGRQEGLNHKDFWAHSITTATAARIMAKAARLPQSDDAFSAGMLHDVGKIVLDVHFKQDYLQVLREARLRKIPTYGSEFIALEEEVLQTTHTSIGSYLASKWKLPVTITEVIQYHHTPKEAQLCETMVYLIALANQLAHVRIDHLGIYDRKHFSEDVLDYFSLDDDTLVGYLNMLKQELESIDEFLQSLSGSPQGR